MYSHRVKFLKFPAWESMLPDPNPQDGKLCTLIYITSLEKSAHPLNKVASARIPAPKAYNYLST